MNNLEEIQKELDQFKDTTGQGYNTFKNTINELCSKGISKGCYQDYGALCSIMNILTFCKNYIKEGDKNAQ
nr:MAG TPA: hypothetical protein [Caudoviricetes sp.]